MFACSGPGAGAAIELSIHIGYINAVVLGLLCLVSVRVARRYRHQSALLVPLALFGALVLHPAWTVRATGGDCGSMKRLTSLLLTGAALFAIVYQVYFSPPPTVGDTRQTADVMNLPPPPG